MYELKLNAFILFYFLNQKIPELIMKYERNKRKCIERKGRVRQSDRKKKKVRRKKKSHVVPWMNVLETIFTHLYIRRHLEFRQLNAKRIEF